MNSPARTAKPHGLHILLAIVVLLLCPLPMAAQQAVTPEQLSVLEKQLDKVAQQMDQLIKDNIRLMQDNSKLMSVNLELMQENQLQRKRLNVLADSILAAQYMAARGSTANTPTSTNDAVVENFIREQNALKNMASFAKRCMVNLAYEEKMADPCHVKGMLEDIEQWIAVGQLISVIREHPAYEDILQLEPLVRDARAASLQKYTVQLESHSPSLSEVLVIVSKDSCLSSSEGLEIIAHFQAKADERTRQAPEQKRLEREIAAVLLLGIDVNDDLPLSLQERAEDNDPPPDNIPDLRLYRYLLGRLHQARGLLAVPPDERASIAAKELEGAVIERERYPGLEEDRMRLVSALLGYCERSNQLARVIQSAAEGRTEAERVVFLDRYQATQYPYLQQQMQRARANAGYRMPATNCQ